MIKQGLISGAETIQRECNDKSYLPGYDNSTSYVLFSILINLIERTRTIKILTEQGQLESIGILTRSFIELVVSIEYILERETDLRAKSYLYHYRISMLKKFQKLGEFNPEYVAISKEAYEIFKDEINDVSSLDDLLVHYKELHDKLYDNPLKHSQKWFNLHGEKRRTFKDLMLSMNYNEDMYLVIYGFGSIDTHGVGALGSINKYDDNYLVEGILPLDLCHSIVEKYLCTTVEKVAKHYGVLKKANVKIAFKQMGTSSTGGNFNLSKDNNQFNSSDWG